MDLSGFMGAQMVEPEDDPENEKNKLQTGGPESAEGAKLGGLLGALLMGGTGTSSPAANEPGGMDLAGLLGGLLGGGLSAPGGTGPAAMPGGGTSQTGGSGGMDLADLLGGLLGGGSPSQSSGSGGLDLAGLLGGLLGGGSPSSGSALGGLAQQAGLSQSVVQIALPLLLNALVQGKQQRTKGIDLGATRTAGITTPQGPYGDLVGRLVDGKPIEPSVLDDTGLPEELARQTGLDRSEATAAIQNLLQALNK